MLLTADLHLREESADVIFGEVLPGILDIALQRGETLIVIDGDLLHVRYQVAVLLYNRLAEALKGWAESGIEIILLPGNHDQVDLAGHNALEVLDEIEGVTVVTEPCWLKGFAWVPYRKDPTELVRILLDLLAREDSQAYSNVFMHAGVTGALQNDSIYDSDGVPLGALVPWNTVVCGHYHKPQTIGNVRYLGSPWQTRADEAGQEKGVWIAPDDPEAFCLEAMEFLPQRWGPCYHNIVLGQDAQLDVSGIDKRDIVRVKTAEGVDPATVGKVLAQAGIERHTVTPTVEAPQERLDVVQGSPLEDYVQSYLKLKLYGSEPAWEMFEQIKARSGGVQ